MFEGNGFKRQKKSPAHCGLAIFNVLYKSEEKEQ